MPLLRAGGLWSVVHDVPDDYVAPPWETLLLDARVLLESERLPDVGPALVLAASALETRIDDSLRQLAEGLGGPVRALWSWLSDRDQWWQEPSISGKLSDVLDALTGRSLKHDKVLWESFRNLWEARNSYVHEGIARIGGQPVTSEQASKLLASIRLIIDWIEDGLPDEARRPRYEREHRFQINMAMTSPEEVQGDQS